MPTITSAQPRRGDGHSLILVKGNGRASSQRRLEQELLGHVTDCLHCLFVIIRQSEPLLSAGCPRFKALFAEAHPLFDSVESPVGSVHLTEDMIENYHFRRLSALENKILEAHVGMCNECAAELHNHRMFIYSLRAALADDELLDRDRNGATFAAAAHA